MPLRAIVFDLFDTLVDMHLDRLPEIDVLGARLRSTYGLLHAVVARVAPVSFDEFARTLRALDRELRDVMHREHREVPTGERFSLLLERLGIAHDGLSESLTATHMNAIFDHVTPLPHHVEVLQCLRERQHIAVCSNFTHAATAHRVIDAAGLASLVDVVVISEEVGVRKPRPEIFRETLARLDVAPHETLHIGDNLDADIAGAAAVGAATGWITRRVSDPQRALRAYEGPLPRVRMRDLSELPGLVDAWR